MNCNPIVSVCMITYGHEDFIAEAINRVLMQECNLEVELILSNDCSPDQTDNVIQDILENHPRRSWVKYFKHEKNIGMMSNFIFALNECQGKYIALCEGDDYWTDPNKLQKQVDFLENNSGYSYCGHKSFVLRNNEIKKIPLEIKDFGFSELIFKNFLNTSTLIFRKSAIEILPKFFSTVFAGDWSLQLVAIKDSKAYVLPDYMSVYREHENGVWSNLDNTTKCFQGVKTQEALKLLYNDKKSISLINRAIKERKKSFGIFEDSFFKKLLKNTKFLRY